MKREIEIEVHNPKVRLENLKKLSGELVDYIEKNFPDLLEEDVDFLTKLLGMELKKLFDKVIWYYCWNYIYRIRREVRKWKNF